MTEQRLQTRPYPLGAHREAGGIWFSFVSRAVNCGIILFDRASGRRISKVPFLSNERMGNVHYKYIPEIDASQITYQFYENDKIVPDSHAKVFVGRGSYGHRREEKDLKAGFLEEDFDWAGDRNPRLPYEEMICYCMHVRGFTRHASSGVEHRGTFRGLMEKLDYLKELGITTIELQPAYEFLEIPTSSEQKKQELPSAFTVEQTVEEAEQTKPSLNYWGYRQGFYYAPKKGYAAGEDASTEFKELMKALHQKGMELVMQFYFPRETSKREIPEILRFWAWEYHVDGFHLMGENLPIELIATDAALVDTKLWYYEFPTDNIYGEEIPIYRNLAVYRDDYMYDMRRFLKGDSDMLNSVLYHMRTNPQQVGRINYFTNYYGFTLADMVSYDYKHNEANGENNRDGNDYNQSWNCGVEGTSRKKQVVALRLRQMKNALSMLFFSQATPLLFMGDEFGNSQKGNNNPYCQDNEVAWLNWKDLERNKELYQFTRELIALRKQHPILHQPQELRIMDYTSCGYPDLSYHGEAAWRPILDNYNRHVGMMYCGKYAEMENGKEDDFFYVALNMHWESHNFAMPRLPKGLKWELLYQTSQQSADTKKAEDRELSQWIPARSVAVYVSHPEEVPDKKGRKNRKGKKNE